MAETFAAIQSCSSAVSERSERSAVLPVPLAPVKIVDRFGSPGPLIKPRLMSRRICSRPARKGGTLPNVGVKGFLLYSMAAPLQVLLIFATFANFCKFC